MDYSTLKPGLYISSGRNTKALSLTNAEEWANILGLDDFGRTQPVEQIAAEVAWVYVALAARRGVLAEIPLQWQRDGDEVDDLPFMWKWQMDLARIDSSLQKRSVAYLFKLRAGSRLVGLQWLNPTTIEPDVDSVDPLTGYTQYIRQTPTQRYIIPAEDVIRIWLPDDAELAPAPSALGAVSRAAQVLVGQDIVADAIFDNGGLPVTLVHVPPQYSNDASQLGRLQDRFSRLFNATTAKQRRINRTAAVPDGVTTTQLSFTPKDTLLMELEDRKVDVILAANEVPKSQVSRAGGGNVLDTTKDNDRAQFVTRMGQRLDHIAAFINDDEDVQASGVRLEVMTDQHPVMSRDNAGDSSAFASYVNGGMTPEASAWLMGISEDDFPEGMQVFEVAPEEVEINEGAPPEGMTRNASEMWRIEAGQFKRWLKNNKGAPVDEFKANHLSETDKKLMILEARNANDAPFPGWDSYP